MNYQKLLPAMFLALGLSVNSLAALAVQPHVVSADTTNTMTNLSQNDLSLLTADKTQDTDKLASWDWHKLWPFGSHEAPKDQTQSAATAPIEPTKADKETATNIVTTSSKSPSELEKANASNQGQSWNP